MRKPYSKHIFSFGRYSLRRFYTKNGQRYAAVYNYTYIVHQLNKIFGQSEKAKWLKWYRDHLV